MEDFFLFDFIFRFPSELNVGHISADTLWKLLSADLKDDLEGKFHSWYGRSTDNEIKSSVNTYLRGFFSDSRDFD